jgi:protein-tyrosine kinase
MSRIEKALERANELRGVHNSEAPAEKTASAPADAVIRTGPELSADSPARPELSADSPYLVTITEPELPVTEEYRKLKSMVVKLTTRGDFLNTLIVTSSLAAEGKSITALNLAVSLAQEYDHTVLLVDADLRKPSLDRMLGIEAPIGLVDCLTDGVDVGKAIINTGLGRLSLLPAGRKVDNPVELLLSSKLKQLVREVKHRYSDRYVIIDTPPLLPFAEVHSLCAVTDGVIFVVREGHTPIGDIQESLGMLKDTRILGVVYNAVELAPMENHYRHYYYRRYHEREGGNGKK